MKTWVVGYLPQVFVTILFPLLLILGLVRPVFAWTQLENNYPNVPPYCGGSSSLPCLYWAEPHNSSVNLYFYIDPSLYPAQHGFDFRTSIGNAFGYYNNVTAWNPYMYTCYGGPCANNAVGSYEAGSTSDPTWICGSSIVYAFTAFPTLGNVEHSGSLYYQFIEATDTQFNPEPYFYWNTSLLWGGNCSHYDADARKVVTHETGHVIGLGHTGHVAVMHQGPENFYTLQPDDISGIQSIYNGSSPSS